MNKDCAQIGNEITDVRAATDEVGRSKVGKSLNIEMSLQTFSLPRPLLRNRTAPSLAISPI